jgi:hypothetical protein
MAVAHMGSIAGYVHRRQTFRDKFNVLVRLAGAIDCLDPDVDLHPSVEDAKKQGCRRVAVELGLHPDVGESLSAGVPWVTVDVSD